MTGPTNTLWAQTLIDELARAGLQHITMAPGSRSTPLVLAAAQHDALTLTVHLDERSAAFHALGTSKATGTPGAIITTSGTAAANLHPAIIEAHHSQTPLLALTADRPHRLRGADANQSIDQVKLYTDHVRAYHDVPPPTADPDALAHLRTLADRALAETQPPHGGPVHLNLPFAKPLHEHPTNPDPHPLHDRDHPAIQGRPNNAPYTDIQAPTTDPDEATLDTLTHQLSQAQRPVIVAGPHPQPDQVGPAAIDLAQTLQAPLLADPLSGARFAPRAPEATIAHATLFLANEATQAALEPDLILRIGQSPTHHPISNWLRTHHDATQILIDDGPIWKDHEALAHHHHRAHPARTLTQLAHTNPTPATKAWTSLWRTLEARTQTHLQTALTETPFEATILTQAAHTLPRDAQLFVGNSMPIRDLEAYTPPRPEPIRVLANRGASGIDGLVSTAIGAAQATNQPTLAVLGDLSTLHDTNGFYALANTDAPVVFLVINNDGGGIFHRLPIHQHPEFEDHFATPHGRSFQHLAQHHDRPYTHLDTTEPLQATLEDALNSPQGQLLEITTDRDTNEARHQHVEAQIQTLAHDVTTQEETPWQAN